jgi:hypothetical protein
MPPPFDPDRARPLGVVYVHLSAEAVTAGSGIARVENVGPVLLSRLQMLLGERCTINVKPVIDLPAGHIPVDCYEIPATLREQLLLRYPADVFPYAAGVSPAIDVDHTIPYLSPDRGRPPGQPGSATSDPSCAAITGSELTVDGRSANPNPAPGYGDHLAISSTWSTPAAPIPSETPHTLSQSGIPRRARHRNGRANLSCSK